MPFGVSNSPAVFQTLVNDVLRDTFNRFVFVYLDDILIFSQNKRHHSQHVRLVLQWLLENRLFAKLEKCEFHVRSVPFLGFILLPEGIRMDPGKVEAVANWPTPDSRKRVHVFLCGSVVEHCVSSAKGCGFDSQGTHILMKMYNLNAIVSRFG